MVLNFLYGECLMILKIIYKRLTEKTFFLETLSTTNRFGLLTLLCRTKDLNSPFEEIILTKY